MFESARRDGLAFECTRCSRCCTGSPGHVWLSETDIDSLCSLLAMDFETFVEHNCVHVKVEGGTALSLREKAGYDCVFLHDGRCSVYAARPAQCRSYPFWDEILVSEESWKAEARYCPGVGKGRPVPPANIAAAILSRRQNPPFVAVREGERKTR